MILIEPHKGSTILELSIVFQIPGFKGLNPMADHTDPRIFWSGPVFQHISVCNLILQHFSVTTRFPSEMTLANQINQTK